MFSHPDYDGHEALLFGQDAASGLRALIAIHNTTLGIAFGGCRIYPYAGEQQAMTERAAPLARHDLDANRCAQAAATYGATLVAPEEIYTQCVDVFAPAALGAF